MEIKPAIRILTVFCVTTLAFVADGAETPTVKSDQVFRCVLNGQVTYSDTACNKDAKKKKVETTLHNTYSSELDDKNSHAAHDPSASEHEKPSSAMPANQNNSSNTAGQVRQGATCQKITTDLIKARSKYSENIRSANKGESSLADVLVDQKDVKRLEEASKRSKCHY